MTTKQITAASYSRYASYTLCPLQAKYRYIDRLPVPSSPAAERGNEIHKHLEDYVNGKVAVKDLLEIAKPFKKHLDNIKTAKIHSTEGAWAFDQWWNPVKWFGEDVFVRIKIDAVSYIYDTETLYVDDYKTGKVYPEHREQMELYAAGGIATFPEAQKIITRLFYLDQRLIKEEEFTYQEATQLQLEWGQKLQPMLMAKRFYAKPNDKCRWCHFRKSNGGPCKHG